MNETLFCSPNSYKVYSKLEAPYSYVYAVFFLLLGIMASSGNFLSLHILKLPDVCCKKKYIILMSLALSDLLVGVVLCPFMVYQMIFTETLSDCKFYLTRAFLVYSIIGPSSMTILIIAYDRYIAITKLWNYDKYMTRTKICTFLFLSWSFPCIGMSFDVASQSLKLMDFYKISRIITMTILSGVLVGIIIVYVVIVVTVRKEDRNRLLRIADTENNSQLPSRQRYLRIANNTSLLVICYVLCYIPSVFAIGIAVVARLLKSSGILETAIYHHFSLFTLITAVLNSCINPFIYTTRYPEFRRHMKRKWKKFNTFISEVNNPITLNRI